MLLSFVKIVTPAVILLSFGNIQTHGQSVVNVSLYYESLCPDCREFDKNQLFPTYKILQQYIHLELVPYGNAQRELINNKWKFTCQHGPRECYGNKVHACVLSNDETSYSQKISFVGCSMSSSDPASKSIGEKCAEDEGLDWNEIDDCATSERGDELLAKYGQETDDLNPPHTYVPWLLFNGVYNSTMNDKAQDNLLAVICSLLDVKPHQCYRSDPSVIQL